MRSSVVQEGEMVCFAPHTRNVLPLFETVLETFLAPSNIPLLNFCSKASFPVYSLASQSVVASSTGILEGASNTSRTGSRAGNCSAIFKGPPGTSLEMLTAASGGLPECCLREVAAFCLNHFHPCGAAESASEGGAVGEDNSSGSHGGAPPNRPGEEQQNGGSSGSSCSPTKQSRPLRVPPCFLLGCNITVGFGGHCALEWLQFLGRISA